MAATADQIMERMQAGDSSAVAELYDEYAARVLGLLVRLLPTRSDADDVLQEVFWQAWKKADRFDANRGNPLAWLLTMARSRAIDWLRRRKTTESISRAPEPRTFDQPVDELEQQESATQVHQLLLKLPDEQRSVIQLSFYEGLAHQDIAAHLEIPLGTAKTRIRLGMKRLRDLATTEPSISQSPSKGRVRHE